MIAFCYFILLYFYQVFSQNATNFICGNGQTINKEKICDGTQDCSDGEDEAVYMCQHMLCPINTFRCYYGACIDISLKCDGSIDCFDGSDENQCGDKTNSCSESQYRCSTGECISIKKLCDGINDCSENSDEGNICKKITCPLSTHRCNIGGCIFFKQICDGHKDCIDGSDESETLCSSLNCNDSKCLETGKPQVFCPLILSERINFRCEIPSGPKKGSVSCDIPLPPGAVVKYECKPYYVPAHSRHNDNKEMRCQMDGTWNRDILHCIPDCGLTSVDVTPLVVQGWITESTKFPWHAVLFTLEDGQWVFTCGGTLITEIAVITAAHCVWTIKSEELQIALSKQYSDYNKFEDNAQFRHISKIILQPNYQDFAGNYGSDIAILVLKKAVQFSPTIRPACIDWNPNYANEELINGRLGLIAGMGLTENNTFSAKLRAVYLPIVNNSHCIESQKKEFKKYLTFTSFCAGWRNGSGVCNGDSGGGLVFPSFQEPKKFSIQGIVSISPRRLGTSFCDPNYYTVFTKVGIYTQWIHDNLQNIHLNSMF